MASHPLRDAIEAKNTFLLYPEVPTIVGLYLPIEIYLTNPPVCSGLLSLISFIN